MAASYARLSCPPMTDPLLPLTAPDDAVALIEPAAETRLTYGELRAEIDRLGRPLVTRGVTPGDVVAFSMANGPEIVTTFLLPAMSHSPLGLTS